MAKRHLPVFDQAFGPEVAAHAVGTGCDRDRVLSAAIQAAMHVLADAPPGETAVISACRGSPLCSAQDNASCALCECITVSEDGIVGYPGSGRA